MKSLLLGAVAISGLCSTAARADDLPPWFYERRIIGHNDLEPIEATLPGPLYAQSRPLARLEGGDGIGFCTAWRAGVDLFLSNYHCFDYKPCSDLQFHLGYERDQPVDRQLIVKCKEVVAKNVTFDYALFRVDPTPVVVPKPPSPPPPPAFDELNATQPAPRAVSLDDFPVATIWIGPLTVGQAVFMPQHPGGRPKEVDRGPDCKLRTVVPQIIEERQTLTHTCDSEGGSSGSPLIDKKTGYVVGLHWGGLDDYNMAIPLSAIVEDIKKTAAPAVAAELQLAQP